ncbi:MAG: FecR domain-containing protein [Planctomycetota bacterium]|jgi:hypothetical protein
MNHCEQYQTIIESYLEGELKESDQILLDEHIQHCAACRDEFQKAQTLALIIGESFQPGRSEESAADSVLNSIAQRPATDKSHSFLTFGKIAATLIMAAGLLLSFHAGRTSAQWQPNNLTQAPYTIQNLRGTVLVRHSNSEIWQSLKAESAVYIDDQFLSTPGAQVTFAADENSFIDLKENSMLELHITPDQTNLHLIRGTLDADLGSPHGPFFVTTPHGQAEALGTEFTIKVN